MSATPAAVALARAILPPGRVLPGGDARTITDAEARLAQFSGGALTRVDRLCALLDHAAIAYTGRRFRALPPARQEALLRRWEASPAMRAPLHALSFLLRQVHFDRPEVYRAMDCPYVMGGPPEPAPWLRQVVSGAGLTRAEDVECDVVVVGSGAGGAVVGKYLADQGLAVVFVEEGALHRRDAFTGHAADAHERFYRKGGMAALGNAVIPIFAGRLVGGSTAINTGTCFRTPPWILDRWCRELGTTELAPADLAPHFDRVERELGVEPARPEYLGGVARVVARGCDALGWHHGPIRRNAPTCDGQGVCDFGCPSAARRSMDLSYLPAALGRGAVLYTEARVERVLIERGRAVGVEAAAAGGGRLRVRARGVVLAGGAIPTPLFLLRHQLAAGSGQVGRNLSLHPCTIVSALFDEPIVGYRAIPQGYTCDEFLADGILLSGASASLDIGAAYFPFHGRRLMDTMEAYDRIASFMVIIRDDGRGRIRLRGDGSPLITYRLTAGDVRRLHDGMVKVAAIFSAAGARRLFPLVGRMPILDGPDDLARFRALRLRARDPLLTSFHPMGTCRLGTDPRTSVVDLAHEVHDQPGLFVVDGSTLPGPPSVNPQLTIMALASRAATRIPARLP